MHRATAWHKQFTTTVVAKAATFTGTLARTIPGLGGALLLCAGLGMVYKPLFFIVSGVLLLIVDRRIP